MFHAPGRHDAGRRCGRRRGRSAASPTSTRNTRPTLDGVKGDIALGKQLHVTPTPTFFINGVKIEGVLAAAVLRSGDRLRARSTPSRRRRAMHALATDELTKDYAVGFWRKRPLSRARSPHAQRRARRGLRLSRPERRRQDHHAQAADAAGLPDRRGARRSSAARSATLGEAPHRLPARTALLLRLPHRRGAARLLRAASSAIARRGAPRARVAAARRSRHRRRAPPAAAQVLERHAAARRHRAGAHQRSRARHPRRADVRPRSARPARRPRADPAAARSRLHGVLQLARAERRRSALQPRGDSGERPPGRPPAGCTRCWRFEIRGWELVVADVSDDAGRALPHARRRIVRIGDGRYTSICRSSRRPIVLLAEIAAGRRARSCRSTRFATRSRTSSSGTASKRSRRREASR